MGFSQTTIGPMVGYNAAEIVESQLALHGDCLNRMILFNKSGYVRNSFKYGLRVNHNINERISITIMPSYMRKKLVDRNCRSFDLKYSIFSGDFVLNLELLKNFNVGIGGVYSNLNSFNFKTPPHSTSENHFGYVISSSYKYKKLVFKLRYRKMKNLKQEWPQLIKSSKSFELSASYMFSVFEK